MESNKENLLRIHNDGKKIQGRKKLKILVIVVNVRFDKLFFHLFLKMPDEGTLRRESGRSFFMIQPVYLS